jgi:2'-5' RNA ligase
MSYRLFIAVELPEHVKDVLVATQDALRAEQPPVRWTARGHAPDAVLPGRV